MNRARPEHSLMEVEEGELSDADEPPMEREPQPNPVSKRLNPREIPASKPAFYANNVPPFANANKASTSRQQNFIKKNSYAPNFPQQQQQHQNLRGGYNSNSAGKSNSKVQQKSTPGAAGGQASVL